MAKSEWPIRAKFPSASPIPTKGLTGLTIGGAGRWNAATNQRAGRLGTIVAAVGTSKMRWSGEVRKFPKGNSGLAPIISPRTGRALDVGSHDATGGTRLATK